MAALRAAGSRIRDHGSRGATREPIVNGTVSLARVDSTRSLFNHKVQVKGVAATISNQDGLFQLITPLPGRYKIQAERIGYQTTESSKLLSKIHL